MGIILTDRMLEYYCSKKGNASAIKLYQPSQPIPSMSITQYGNILASFWVYGAGSGCIIRHGEADNVNGMTFTLYKTATNELYVSANTSNVGPFHYYPMLSGVPVTANGWTHVLFGIFGSECYIWINGTTKYSGTMGVYGRYYSVISPLKLFSNNTAQIYSSSEGCVIDDLWVYPNVSEAYYVNIRDLAKPPVLQWYMHNSNPYDANWKGYRFNEGFGLSAARADKPTDSTYSIVISNSNRWEATNIPQIV